MFAWWADLFWSRTHKVDAAFRRGFALGFLTCLILASMFGCTTVAHAKVEGWPTLKVTEHKVSFSVMHGHCQKYVGFGNIPLACSEFNLDQGWCRIWYVWDFTLDHERKHCEGYPHLGDEGMANYLKAWRGK